MRFMLLIYEDESATLKQGEPGWQELWDAYVALDEAARAAGALVDSQPLQPSAAALRVRLRDGSPAAERGPARSGPLQLTGYYIVDVPGEDEAAEWAARIPAAASGGIVEVRALFKP